MPWEESSPGKYTRQLDNAELLLKTVATPFQALNREHWAINFVAGVKLDNKSIEETTSALRSAWIALRYHHPHMATALGDTSITYQVPDKAILDSWLSESFFIHKDKNADEYLFSAPWMKYTSLHYFPNSSEILVRNHHWLVDGIGSLHIANRFFELFALGDDPPTFGDEWKNLPPSLQEANGLPAEISPAGKEEATKMFMDFAGKMPSIGLPTEISQETPGGTLCSTLEYPPTVFDKLLSACRKQELSVTSAVHAAVVVATQELSPEFALAKNYTTFACFDYRSYLPAPYNNVSAWPMGVYMLGLPTSLPPAGFSIQAKELQKVYKQPLARDQFPALEYYDQYSGMMAAALSQPPPPGMPLPTTPSISGIGAMDRRVKARYEGKNPVEIERTVFRSDVMAPPLAMYQWSWQGKFTINACYNEVYYRKGLIDEFMARVENILFQELGI